MSKLVRTLMERDGVTKDEAKRMVDEVREEILEAVYDGDYNEAEEIMLSELGLEMDYIYDIL
jgi:polyhydroxyalkanoate synthesis regulator phasin